MEEIENENETMRTKGRSPSPGIKSTAVVKYTAFKSPVSYARLQCNTDLNMPPSNYSAAIDSYGLKQIMTESTGFSSFRMAHMFPDSVGEVDVISGAECIKKLLKLPYQPNGTVSMMVHRIENTLLLDDFDVYDYLMKSEWSWLKDFFYENILKTKSEQERMALTLAPAPTKALQLTNKFLSHSVAAPPQPLVPTDTPACIPGRGPFLPEAEAGADAAEHGYSRNVLWNFEDIRMLIGSDLPIFGDTDRPCVSLRLRDAREPVSVLTGIDYWLDNLMCNVPEVLMCYHLDGIVQKYEPMKTEELPNMTDSRFSPKVIRNVAQNILSFLKSNATRAGHTYWLFKGPRDDVVKLYDLTPLCADRCDNPFTTPVAMLLYRLARNMRLTNRSKHVRQLLEHVIELLAADRYPQIVASSHYMLADLYVPATTDPAQPSFKDESSDSESEDVDYSPDYPDEEKDEHIPESESQKETASTEVVKSELDSALAVQIRGLSLRDIGNSVRDNSGQKHKGKSHKVRGKAPPERCGRALSHALRGLRALHNITVGSAEDDERDRLRQQIINEELHPKMANPYEPIKMEYEPIRKSEIKEHASRSRRRKRKPTERSLVGAVDKNAILVHNDKKPYPSWQEPNRDDNFAWKLHLKTLLYEKICLAYTTLAEHSYSNEQYGFSLKYIDMASKCQKLLSNMIIRSKVVDLSCLIGRVGDNFFQLSKHWSKLEQFRKQLESDHEVDRKLKAEIEEDLLAEVDGVVSNEFDIDVSLPRSETQAMEAACAHYSRAGRAAGDKRCELLRRAASVNNELAVRYMNDAHETYVKYLDAEENSARSQHLLQQFTKISQQALTLLEEATAAFRTVKDVPNLALLHCNKGRYLRMKAHCEREQSFTQDKRRLYKEAEELYLEALAMLGARADGGAGSVRGLVSWELSCHLYTRAALLQDEPGRAPEPSEVADALKHALKYCPLSAGPRQYLYQFRAAMIYHRLASLYHSQYRVTPEDGPKRRTLFAATRANYSHCDNLFAALEEPAMFLTARLEHVALLEAQAAVSPNLKLKSLQTALQLLRQSHSIMKILKNRQHDDEPKTDDKDQKSDDAIHKLDETDVKNAKNELNLLNLYENRLHHILKSVIQYCRSKSNKDYEKMTETYKKLYCASLRIKKDENVQIYASTICDVLEAMDGISKDYES